MNIVAGQELYAKLQAEKAKRVPPGLYANTYASEPLCEWQRELSSRGIFGAQIINSIYGSSVRYDSGLQNFGLLKGCRGRPASETTREAAIEFCKSWVAQDPSRRYAWE